MAPVQIGEYPVVRRLGAGGMGTVFLGIQERVGRRLVAVKVMHGTDPLMIDRMEREIRVLGDLRSPRVAQVFDAGQDSWGRPFLVMEYCPGGSVADQLELRCRREVGASLTAAAAVTATPARLEIGEAGSVVASVAEALAELHALGLVHRDVKPRNVLVSSGGQVVLGDFGVVRAGVETTSAGVVGTALYAAPELHAGEPASPASDTYALGVMAYELLVGVHPYPGTTATTIEAARAARRSPLREAAPGCPTVVADLIEACMAPDPAQRPRDLHGFAEAIRENVDCKPISVIPLSDETLVDSGPLGEDQREAISSTLSTWWNRYAFHVLAGVLALPAIALSVLLWLQQSPSASVWRTVEVVWGVAGIGVVGLLVWVTSWVWSERSENRMMRWWALAYPVVGVGLALAFDWDYFFRRPFGLFFFLVAYGYAYTFIALVFIQCFGGIGRTLGRRAGLPRMGWWIGLFVGFSLIQSVALYVVATK